MDEHARDKHEDDVDVFPGDGAEGIPLPGGAHLLHHVLRGVPGDFVRFGGVKVRACAEEESREGDEHEGERHVPGHVKPVVRLLAEQAEDEHGIDAEEQHTEIDGGNREDGDVVVLEDDGACGEQDECGARAEGDAALAPDFVEHLAKAVEAAPDDEVPACTVPPAAHDLGCHGVHVGGDELAGIGFEVCVDADVEEERAEGDTDPHAARKHDGHKAQEAHPEERAESRVAVAAQRNIQVVAPPARKRDVPTAPEFGGGECLVGAVEVLRQAEPHEERNADGDVCIAREVGVDLQGVGEERDEVLEARIK